MKQILISTKTSILSAYFLATSVLLLPILLHPEIITKRNNDLSEFFIPYIYFVKTSLLEHRVLPLWNNSILSGTPLLPDPQAPIFYLPNLLFLFLPVETGYILLFFIHIFFSGILMYVLCKKGFKLNTLTSFLIGLIYLLNPKMSGYMETGHVGLLTIFTWMPLVVLSIIKIVETKKLIWMFSYGFFFSFLYYSHLLTSLLLLAFSIVFFLVLSISKKAFRNTLLFFILANIIFITFISIQLLPQLEWRDQTTRFILVNNPDIYPKWLSKKEFLISVFSPLLLLNESDIDPEKWISVGLTTSLLFVIGIKRIKKNYSFILIGLLVMIIVVFSNNITPFPRLIDNTFFALLRVTTRFWIIYYLIILFVCAIGIKSLMDKKRTRLLTCLIFLCIAELIVLNWFRFYKPISTYQNILPDNIYPYIQNDNELFRVFCLNRCIPQQESAKRNIEIIDGYNTLQQKDYNQQMWQFTGKYWDYYSLSQPPIGVYLEGITQPDTKALGAYNAKYIISAKAITNSRLKLIIISGRYYLYQNLDYLPRIYPRNEFKNNSSIMIENYQPNSFKFTVDSHQKHIIIANVYNSGWRAYLNGYQEVKVQKTPSNLQQVDISQDTRYVTMIYRPTTFIIGAVITSTTYLFFIILLSTNFYLRFHKSSK